MRYGGNMFANPGSMPNTLPGMSPRLSSSWVARQKKTGGFNKAQILEVEGCRQNPIGSQTSKVGALNLDFAAQKEYNIISPRATSISPRAGDTMRPKSASAATRRQTSFNFEPQVPVPPSMPGRSSQIGLSPRNPHPSSVMRPDGKMARPGSAAAASSRGRYGRSLRTSTDVPAEKVGAASTGIRDGTIGMSVKYQAAAGWRPMSAGAARGRIARGTGLVATGTHHDSKGISEALYGGGPPRAHIPQYIEDEKKVLRYYCYFTETNPWRNQGTGLPDCAMDQLRICMITYYIADSTLAIYLNEKTNSGVTGGIFFKKSHAYHSDGTLIAPSDIIVGESIKIVGRSFTITDADKFTRDFMNKEFNIKLARPHPYPDYDNHKTFGAEHATGMGKPRLLHKKAASTTGKVSAQHTLVKEQMKKAAQFYAHDKHVLRFQAMWDDRSSAGGQLNPFEVHYYLADDTIEVREKLKDPLRRGYAEFPILLKKCRCPKNWDQVKKGQPPDYVTPDDLICGSFLHVFGRPLKLLSCDLFTQQYYSQHYGLDQPSIEAKPAASPPKKMPIPILGDGFLPIGSEEDTIGTVWGFKRPVKDMDKLMKNQNKMMRARMKLAEPAGVAINADRRFILTYYLEDDTLAVYEEPLKNAGIGLTGNGGTYLKKGKYKNALTEKNFQAPDVFTDGLICVEGYEPLRILEMDLHSLLYMENNNHEFKFSDMDTIMRKILDRLGQRNTNLRAICQARDPTRHGTFEYKEMIEALVEANVAQSLNLQEIITVCRFFSDPDEMGLPSITQPIRYRDLCDMAASIATLEMFEDNEGKKFAIFLRNCENAIVNDDTVRDCLTHANALRVRGTLAEVNDYLRAPQTRSVKEWSIARQKYQAILEPLISDAFLKAYGIKFSCENTTLNEYASPTARLYRRMALSRVMWRANFRGVDVDNTGFIQPGDIMTVAKGNSLRLSSADLAILTKNFSIADGSIPYHDLCDAVFDWNVLGAEDL
jgi:hypothetical protein